MKTNYFFYLLAACLLTSGSLFSQTLNFNELNANQGSNKSIEWFTSSYQNGYGHRIYNSDPGGKTLLNFAGRNNQHTWTDILTLTSDHKVGIGTTDPAGKLDINPGGFNNLLRFSFDQSGDSPSLRIYRPTGELNPSNVFPWWIELGQNGMLLFKSGNRAVRGSESVSTQMAFSPAGQIMCKELKVTLNVPNSDHVFETDYHLRSLDEVEDFVKKNKHLPEIPSAQEFKEEGYSIGDMDDLLLRKVEELTLYAIQMQKDITLLKQENEALKATLMNKD